MIPPPSSAEEALAQQLAEQARAEIDQDLAALAAFVEAHGSFAEMAREHYLGNSARASTCPTVAQEPHRSGDGGLPTGARTKGRRKLS
jgi:hypothetical protein